MVVAGRKELNTIRYEAAQCHPSPNIFPTIRLASTGLQPGFGEGRVCRGHRETRLASVGGHGIRGEGCFGLPHSVPSERVKWLRQGRLESLYTTIYWPPSALCANFRAHIPPQKSSPVFCDIPPKTFKAPDPSTSSNHPVSN